MALSATEEALVRQLLDQQAAILSLAGNEATISSKLGATKVTLSDLVSASSITDSDLLLTRQGTTDKSVSSSILAQYVIQELLPFFDASLTNNGYQKLPSGLIVQWTTTTFTGGPSGLIIVTNPIAFPNLSLASFAIDRSNNSNKTVYGVDNAYSSLTGVRYSYYRVQGSATSSLYSFSIGY